MENAHVHQYRDPHLSLRDPASLPRFLQAARVTPSPEPDEWLLRELCAAFSRLPYENLTKIIKSGAGIRAGHAKRLPDEVLHDYARYGAGGTCFSLTAACVAVLTACGFEAYPLLADRHYGSDTHCALMLCAPDGLRLLDPGYLIYQPVRLPTDTPLRFSSGFHALELCPREAGRRVELATLAYSTRRVRLTYKIEPVDGPTFGRAWERSFAWEMMTYPVLTRSADGVQHYLQGGSLRTRTADGTVRTTLSSEETAAFISGTLGIHATLVKQALTLVA